MNSASFRYFLIQIMIDWEAKEITWSVIVNFIAVTILLRMSEDWDFRPAWSSGNSLWGSTKQSLPKHSATTLRVPTKKIRMKQGSVPMVGKNYS